MMRVLHTIASLDPASGGPARSVPALVKALAAAGAKPELWVAAGWKAEWLAHLGLDGLPLHRGALPSLERFDLVHDHGLWLKTNHDVALEAARRRTPRIVSPRGMLEPWALHHKKWKKRLAWCLYQRRDLQAAAALHATADSERNQFQRLGLKQPVAVIPNGVEVPPAPARPVPPLPACKTALFLSRIQKKKGLSMLVEAWSKVRPEGWKMRVVGPDEDGHRKEVEALVREAGLSAEWDFEGAVEGDVKRSVLAEADLFILPTYSENFGMAVAEALAAGLPVITTTGAPWAGLGTRHCGWWTEATVDSIAIALQDACTTDAGVLAAMGRRGREWMKSEFQWEAVGQKMLAAYEEVLSR
jgi:glycosyltransferase involved in cell wall biosynthesis